MFQCCSYCTLKIQNLTLKGNILYELKMYYFFHLWCISSFNPHCLLQALTLTIFYSNHEYIFYIYLDKLYSGLTINSLLAFCGICATFTQLSAIVRKARNRKAESRKVIFSLPFQPGSSHRQTVGLKLQECRYLWVSHWSLSGNDPLRGSQPEERTHPAASWAPWRPPGGLLVWAVQLCPPRNWTWEL